MKNLRSIVPDEMLMLEFCKTPRYGQTHVEICLSATPTMSKIPLSLP